MSIQKLSDYFEYENQIYYTKEELIQVLRDLKIKTSIQYLLKQKRIASLKKNDIYQVLKNKESLTDLVKLVFKNKEAYYFSGVYAYNQLNILEQVAQSIQITNTDYSGKKTMGGFQFIFHKKKAAFIYGIDRKTQLPYIERLLLDYCHEYGFEKFEELYNKLKSKINLKKLIGYSLNYPINSVSRRVLYHLNKDKPVSKSTQKAVITSSLITLYSKSSRRGSIDRDWNIIINR